MIIKDIWQLPQNLAGCIAKKIFRTEFCCTHYGAIVHVWKRQDGVSLGKHIFVPEWADLEYIKHEYGHTIQSKYLGWFYLLLIGLPSIIWAGCFKGYRKKHNVSYYSFYTEKWADKLGGVTR